MSEEEILNKYAIEFKDYKDLPFSEAVNDLLFKFHRHDENGLIIYDEKDVIIMLHYLMKELI